MNNVSTLYRIFQNGGIGFCRYDFISGKRSIDDRAEIHGGHDLITALTFFVGITANDSDIMPLHFQMIYQIVSSDGCSVIRHTKNVADYRHIH